jgi:hypothetical protein
MKPIKFAINAFLLLISVCGLAFESKRGAGEVAEHPKDGFASLQALRTFAETSSFGGGVLTTHRLGDRDIYVVNRCFTSGAPTSELSVYLPRPKGDGFYSALIQPIRMVEIRSEVVADAIIFEQYDYDQRSWVTAMTLTKHFFRP